MKDKKLIINADDFGSSSGNNEAIKQCFELGKISDTSIMARGEAFGNAVSILKDLGIKSVGVHLTLTGGTMPANYFEFCKRYFLGKIKKETMIKELDDQIKKVAEEGLIISHLDSHEHVHMLPGIMDIVIALSIKHNVPNIRLPLEPCTSIFKNFNLKDFIRYKSLKFFAYLGKRKLNLHNIKHNDYFLGHFHSTKITKEIFEYMITNLKPGTTEIAFHPGSNTIPNELETLLSIETNNLNLISYLRM